MRHDSRGIARFFFFQAEDGIRDDLVTGVQTCALPISSRTPPQPRPGSSPAQPGHAAARVPAAAAQATPYPAAADQSAPRVPGRRPAGPLSRSTTTTRPVPPRTPAPPAPQPATTDRRNRPLPPEPASRRTPPPPAAPPPRSARPP